LITQLTWLCLLEGQDVVMATVQLATNRKPILQLPAVAAPAATRFWLRF
jgi:hypothetical protein